MTKKKQSQNTKVIIRSTILLVAFLGVIILGVIFRPKPILYALADLARKDEPNKPTLSTVIISASSGEKKADIFSSTAKTSEEAFASVLNKTSSSPDYNTYKFFRIDAAYGADAVNQSTIINSLPNITPYSYFASIDQKPKKLSTKVDSLSRGEVLDIIHKNASFLSREINSDGKFTFGRDIFTNEELSGYSTNAHASAISAVLRAHSISPDPYFLQQVEKTLDYLTGFVVISDADPTLAYAQNSEASAIDLGATALTVNSLIDYRNATDSVKYDDLIKQLINGVESMYIGADCQLYDHELDLNLTPRGIGVNSLYNVHATSALLNAYDLFKDSSYLEKAERNIDFMLERDYATSSPYWFPVVIKSYNDITKATDKYADVPAPTLRSAETIYANFVEPWVAIFSESPASVLHSFYNSSDNLRSRIDDNQAAIFELIDLLDTY